MASSSYSGPARYEPSGARIALPPRPIVPAPAISEASGKSSGYADSRWKCAGATTYARLSRAMWTSVCCHASPSSAVEAT